MKIKHITQICALVAVTMLLAMPSYAAYDPSLIGYWKLDETSGTTASDATENNDASLHNFTGTYWVGGQTGNALQFDRVDDYGKAATSDFKVQPATISLWMKTDGTASWAPMVCYHNYNAYYGWNVMTVGDLAVFEYTQTNGGDLVEVFSTSTVENNEWHHIAVTDDGTNITMYVDGVLENSVASVTPVWDTTMYLYFGCGRPETPPEVSKYFYDGLIDEVAIWDKGLNAEQVENLYSWGVEGFEASGQIPEPASMLFALAGVGFALKRRRRL